MLETTFARMCKMFPWAILIVLVLTILLIKAGWFWRVFSVVGCLCFLTLMLDLLDGRFSQEWHSLPAGRTATLILITISLVWIYQVLKRIWVWHLTKPLPETDLKQNDREF